MTETSDAVVLRGRTAPTPVRREPSQDAQIERARLYAQASGFVPSAFAGKPGACLLAMDWAAKNGLDDLTALQGLHVIDGKPSVSAALRVDLATKAGFEFRVLTTNTEECSLDVYDHRSDPPRKLTGEPVTITIGEIPSYRFNKTSNNKESNWTLYPADMLFAHACRVADRRYVKTSAALIDARQDYDEFDEQSPLDLLEPVPEADDTEVIEAGATAAVESASDDERKEALMSAMKVVSVKQRDLLVATSEICGEHHPTVSSLAANPEHTTKMLDWIEDQ